MPPHPELVAIEAGNEVLCGQEEEKDNPDGVTNLFQPLPGGNAEEGMDELDIQGWAEKEEKIGTAIDGDGQSFIGNDVHQGHIGVDQRPHETDSSEKAIGALAAPGDYGDQGQCGQDKKPQNRRNHLDIRCFQVG